MRRTPIKKEIVFLFFALASLLATLAILFYLGRQSYGHLCIYVADAYTLSPLGGAVVVLPESGLQAETDEFGKADFFNVPVVKNKELEKLCAQSYGQTTILCFKKGYQPYALFYAQIQPGRVREGPTLYMFPEGSEAGCVIEAPQEEWIARLFTIYDPFHK